jgi:hypothetical protein
MGFVKLVKLGQELNSCPNYNFSVRAISRWIQMDMNCLYSSTSSGSSKAIRTEHCPVPTVKNILFQSGFN